MKTNARSSLLSFACPPRRLSYVSVLAATCVLCTYFAVSSLHAATTTWSGPNTGGVFNDDANWTADSPGDNTPPPNGLNDLGIFNNTTNVNGTITFDANATHASTQFRNTSGTITFNTGAFKWTTTGNYIIGAASPEVNTIRLVGGSIETGITLLGNNAGSPGNSVEVTGAGTLWHSTSTGAALRVGSGGSPNSTFTVHNGAKATTLGQTTIGLVGSSGGRLFVTDTGVLETANYLGVGHSAGGTPSVNATNNEAHILNGGTVKASHTLMGITAGATDSRTLVSGAGSTLTLTGVGTQAQIGMVGINNTLEIANGGAVLGGNRFRLGVGAASTGNKLIINNGSLTGTAIEAIRGDVTITNSTVELNDYLNMGNFIEGTLAATDVGTSSITYNSGSVKAVRANINNGLQFSVGDGGATSATYEMKKTSVGLNATHTFANGLFLNSNAILKGNGDIVGNVASAVGAQIGVGTSAGLINVNGAWNNTGASVALEVGDLSFLPAQPGVGYDLLNVTGAFTHGGAVSIDVSSFAQGSGFAKDFKLVGWGSEVGSTAATNVSFVGGPALPYQFRSDGLYLTNVSFSIVPEPSTLAISLFGLVLCAVRCRRNAS